jgi:hypothetical protein
MMRWLNKIILEPGDNIIIVIAFDEYLEANVHQLQVLHYCGPVLWMEKK